MLKQMLSDAEHSIVRPYEGEKTRNILHVESRGNGMF
jgi:hypothetical protein